MDPRNQTVKGQREVGHLPFPTQAAWICAAKQCSLKYPNPESSFGWAFPNEAQEGTEGTQGPQENEEPLWNDQKTLATGQLKHLFHRAEHSCCSLSHRFNFKYTQYSRKWWNQSHCSLVDTRMDLSVQHHLVDLSKTFHRQKFALSYLSCTFQQSWQCPSRAAAPLCDFPSWAAPKLPLMQSLPHRWALTPDSSVFLSYQPSGAASLGWEDIWQQGFSPCRFGSAVLSQTPPQPCQEFALPDSF